MRKSFCSNMNSSTRQLRLIGSLLIGVVLFVLPLSVQAATWVQVDAYAGASIDVDIDSIRYTDEKTRSQCETKSTHNGMYAISIIYVDFLRKTYAVGKSQLFDGNHKLLSASAGRPESYEPIQPNTLGEKLFQFLEFFREEPASPPNINRTP